MCYPIWDDAYKRTLAANFVARSDIKDSMIVSNVQSPAQPGAYYDDRK